MVYPARPAEDRFWEKVNKEGPVIIAKLGPCWMWTAAADRWGYGRFALDPKTKSSAPAFRVAFEWENGPLAPGMQADHLCHNTLCVRPSHMEAVTAFENNSRAHKKR